jgi:hypothetical protein
MASQYWGSTTDGTVLPNRFTLEYEEMGNGVYGKTTFKDGILTDVYLEEQDFETIINEFSY